jgi:hypothetical protein
MALRFGSLAGLLVIFAACAGNKSASTGDMGAGGSAASSSGPGGGSQHPNLPLAPCPTTPNEAGVGVWEDITPAEFKVRPTLVTFTVAVDPLHPGTAYASAGDKSNSGTGSVGVFRTTDCGAHWSKVSAAGSMIETGDVWQLVVDFQDSNNLYANDGYGSNPTLYKSADGGVTWSPLATDVNHVLQYNFVRGYSMDPTNTKHIVLGYHELCGAPLSPLCVAETTDGGASWRQFNGPPIAAADLMGDGGGPFVVDANQIFFFHPSGLWYTSDGGKTWVQHFESYKAPLGGPPWTFYMGTNGALYLGVGITGIFRIQASKAPIDASAWALIPGSPQPTAMVDDGKNLYASSGYDMSGHPIYSASLGDLTKWSSMTSTGMSRGTGAFSYDRGHGVLYSANWQAGLWRLRTM